MKASRQQKQQTVSPKHKDRKNAVMRMVESTEMMKRELNENAGTRMVEMTEMMKRELNKERLNERSDETAKRRFKTVAPAGGRPTEWDLHKEKETYPLTEASRSMLRSASCADMSESAGKSVTGAYRSLLQFGPPQI